MRGAIFVDGHPLADLFGNERRERLESGGDMAQVETIEEIAQRIAGRAALIDEATHAMLTDLRAFDAERGWALQGASSFAQWLSWRCGLDVGTAREKIRVALALAGLPLIDEALRRGEVGFSKARAMTRVATPANERELLEIARSSTAAQLERVCRLFRSSLPVQTPRRGDFRRMIVRDMHDGTARIDIRLPTEEAERLLRACSAAGSRRVDGLMSLMEASLRGAAPSSPPVEVRLELSAETLEGRGERVGISAETGRRLLCDGRLVATFRGAAGTELVASQKQIAIPTAVREELVTRDKGCRFPGCEQVTELDVHQLKHWVDGGSSVLENLVLVCAHHHAWLHEGGFRAEGHAVGCRFHDPSGRRLAADGRAVRRRIPSRSARAAKAHNGPADYAAAVRNLRGHRLRTPSVPRSSSR
jgi:hypothetical protein